MKEKGRIVFFDASIFDFREMLSHKDHDYRFHLDGQNELKLVIEQDREH